LTMSRFFAPDGAVEDSPAIYCWERGQPHNPVPEEIA
jgi:hypothetical protein